MDALGSIELPPRDCDIVRMAVYWVVYSLSGRRVRVKVVICWIRGQGRGLPSVCAIYQTPQRPKGLGFDRLTETQIEIGGAADVT